MATIAPMSATTKVVRISEAARACGLHPNTIRTLERRGRITIARDWQGHRRFTRADIDRLRHMVGLAERQRQ